MPLHFQSGIGGFAARGGRSGRTARNAERRVFRRRKRSLSGGKHSGIHFIEMLWHFDDSLLEVDIIISLNHRDARPLHEQVREGIRQLIVGGAMREKERLPAVREMAAALAINPNTIARAYRDLESEGYVYSIAGIGTFVAPRGDAKEQRVGRLLPEWEKITAELIYLGMSVEELAGRMRELNPREGEFA